jgi:hypothetical protein
LPPKSPRAVPIENTTFNPECTIMMGLSPGTVRRWVTAGLTLLVLACDDKEDASPIEPGPAPRARIDRFSDAAGNLFRRSAMPSLPAPDQPIDLDRPPFITRGLGPTGQRVRYYNFDVMPEAPAPIYVLFRQGETQPVAEQQNIVDAIPGEVDYSDFWQVVRVTVPANYVANTVRSLAQIVQAGYPMERTPTVVNCPIVPEGSTGREGGAADGLTRGWYKGQLVFYFNFGDAPNVTATGVVPTSPIFVTFNVNPDQPNGGPPSGFRTEPGTDQTHNVVATIPGQTGYSPLWLVIPYDNADFGDVRDRFSAQAAALFPVAGVVNCPVVFME